MDIATMSFLHVDFSPEPEDSSTKSQFFTSRLPSEFEEMQDLCDDSFLHSKLTSPDSSEDVWDAGFCSPCKYYSPDTSPVKLEMDDSEVFESRTPPPLSPPSLCGLRLFDTPHTPKSLLERSGSTSPGCKSPVRLRKFPGTKLRRNIERGGRRIQTEPRNSTRSVYANVNPFTPNGSANLKHSNKNKRTRNHRLVYFTKFGSQSLYLFYHWK